MKKTLIQFKDWSVCESDERLGEGKFEVYAEHDTCSNTDTEDNAYTAKWSWEFRDKVRKQHGYEGCWECEARVPDGVIALVRLHNWGRVGEA